ncbi:peptidoglycan-recognition protein SB1-like isoform X2 [Macrosteles quadrilineatus]|uniref:peptidoglycan-recognition protein SB1-like isoform X2 n=1 Tax=Macrosteles quadrilineatus TaxID=74068 RepID=UPI0023E312E3|nr:peptidoglycan-recognition protein SB1-like isoform X2 [Macrosteles quadrilineatus]
MEDHEGVYEIKPRNNPYTTDDLLVLDKMKKIPHDATEFNEKITFTFCSREMWGAMDPDPRLPMRKVKFPASHVRFVDTGTDECYTPYECFRLLQHLQKDHMEKENLPDIKYNFMVAADGTIYEGRGWRNDADRPEKFNHLQTNCIDIAFIGNINDKEQDDYKDAFPRMRSTINGNEWVEYAKENKYLTKDCEILSIFDEVLR